jgi:hypothetical protein
LNSANLDALDIEGTLAFAEHLLADPARMWTEATPEQKRHLQSTIYPKGLTFGNKAIETPAISPIFKDLQRISEARNGMASPS